MGPYTQPIVPIFTIPLLKGQPQCLSFYPSRLQHRPSFLRAPYGQKTSEWHGVHAAKACLVVSATPMCVFVCVRASFDSFLTRIVCANFQLSKLKLHATCYHWFFYMHTC